MKKGLVKKSCKLRIIISGCRNDIFYGDCEKLYDVEGLPLKDYSSGDHSWETIADQHIMNMQNRAFLKTEKEFENLGKIDKIIRELDN